MNTNFKKIYEVLKRPRKRTLAIAYILTAISITAALVLMVHGSGNFVLEILSYVSYALAAITLAYTVYTIVIFAPGAKQSIMTRINSNRLARRLVSSWGFRTLVTATVSLAMSVAYAVFNGVLGITAGSIWYGALAAYYLCLAAMRGGLLLYHRNKRNFESEALIRAKNYFRCGITLLILNAALSSAIAQMIFDGRGFEYKDWIIYAFAAYAFYKISFAIYNAIKARRQDDLTIQAIREINLVDGAVSILALQTALLHTFTTDGSVDISLFNTLTGSAVSLFSLALSIYMIVVGSRTVRELKSKGGMKIPKAQKNGKKADATRQIEENTSLQKQDGEQAPASDETESRSKLISNNEKTENTNE